jgi:hypothetical protein
MGYLPQWSIEPSVPEVGIGDFWNQPNQDVETYGFGFGANSSSLVSGQFGMTQLIIRNSSIANGLDSWSDWRLDNTLPYSSIGYQQGNKPPYIAHYSDSDNPSLFISTTDTFKQYFMYNPKTSGSIWVTLGIADWNWHGAVHLDVTAPNGWSWSDRPQFYHSQSITPSTQLPEWTNRKFNNGGSN